MDASERQAFFEEELKKALQRLRSRGMKYPPGYYEKLRGKYRGFRYPHIIKRLGEPNIRNHPAYRSVLERKGELLDYGCGTGDDIRALIKDGYPKGRINGFDVDWNSIKIGFDFYMDRKRLERIFTVSKAPHFRPGSFDIVYSGSVLHDLKRGAQMESYLSEACEMLKSDGLLFGSTIGAGQFPPKESGDNPRTMLMQKELRDYLRGSGFNRIRISMTASGTPQEPRYRLWFSGVV